MHSVTTRKAALAALLVLAALLSIFAVGKRASDPAYHQASIDALAEKQETVLELTAASTAASAAITLLPGDTATPIAEKLAISDILAKYPYEVSGGQKQRAAVARALITQPKIVLADEPTGALDSKATDDLLTLFDEINSEGQTILMVTHSVKAASHARRVLFIKDGEVFHQIYRGEAPVQEQYQKIADTLTLLSRGERHE